MHHSCRQWDAIGTYWLLIIAAACFSTITAVCVHADDTAALPVPAGMEQQVLVAAKPNPSWDGPRSGPAGVAQKTIAMICEDLRNGGILGVAQGVREAAESIRWQIKVFDARGTPAGRDKAMADARALRPDGLILVGADAGILKPGLLLLAESGVPMVGWHVGAQAGPVEDNPIAMNISTDPLEVARIAAFAAVVQSGGQAGVVIFTDSNFEIAMSKSRVMAKVIRSCTGCTLLEVCDVAISQSAGQMPELTRELLARYGKRWTYALAINDIYFDYAVPELIKAGEAARDIRFISAGDGSPSAFMRIRAGIFQTGTVAEPLNMHGWQLVDELNRLLAHQAVTGYIAPVHLVTPENVMFDGGLGLQYDPENGYRDVYRHIWKQ
jgi:ribose transport system substrate-binding protein